MENTYCSCKELSLQVLPSDTISLAVTDSSGYVDERDAARLVAALKQDAIARMRQ